MRGREDRAGRRGGNGDCGQRVLLLEEEDHRPDAEEIWTRTREHLRDHGHLCDEFGLAGAAVSAVSCRCCYGGTELEKMKIITLLLVPR